ncbi:hypothetical protein TrVE_jg8845 [Triparma verrucosa]|uniref:Uncharacterized protein n=1 Tax=Triparma verrucosa TaxID=1606542 RepID=A0A9W7FNF5_9STRA|nr:hypothetical protein TrVE_jg8845 [Triparma verrucosa]
MSSHIDPPPAQSPPHIDPPPAPDSAVDLSTTALSQLAISLNSKSLQQLTIKRLRDVTKAIEVTPPPMYTPSKAIVLPLVTPSYAITSFINFVAPHNEIYSVWSTPTSDDLDARLILSVILDVDKIIVTTNAASSSSQSSTDGGNSRNSLHDNTAASQTSAHPAHPMTTVTPLRTPLTPGWKLITVSHRKQLLRSETIVIAVDNVPLPPLFVSYPTSKPSKPNFVHLLGGTAYASVLMTTNPIPVNEVNTLSIPFILSQDTLEGIKLEGYQTQNYNSFPLSELEFKHEKINTNEPQQVLLNIKPVDSNTPYIDGVETTVRQTFENLHEVFDGMLASIVPGCDHELVSAVVDFLRVGMEKAKVNREWAVRENLGIKLSHQVLRSLGADDTPQNCSPPVPSTISTSLILLCQSLLKSYAVPATPMTLHLRLSDVSSVPLQMFLTPNLYCGSIDFAVMLTQIINDTYGKPWAGEWLERSVSVKTYLDFLRLRHSYPSNISSPFTPLATDLLTILTVTTLKSPSIAKGENAVRNLIECIFENGLSGVAGTAVVSTMKKVIEYEDQVVNKRFGQALLLHQFHALAPCLLMADCPTKETRGNWRTCLEVFCWLSSAAGDLGAECSRSLGGYLMAPARDGALTGVVNDSLINYLFLGGPNSNINRLQSVLPLMLPLLTTLTNPLDVEEMTKFLAVAGVSLKSDFVAVGKVVGVGVGDLVSCVLEIERMAENSLIDVNGDESDKLRACQDLVLDATASLLVCAFRGGGSSSTEALRSVVKEFKNPSHTHLTTRLISMSLQRAARSEEVPWSDGLKEGISRASLLIEERGLLKKHQGDPLTSDEIKLVSALIEIMRVGRESPHQGWHQVSLGQSTDNNENMGGVGLLKILQPALRVTLGVAGNVDGEVAKALLAEVFMTLLAASSGLAFAAARDVGLLVLASIRRGIRLRVARNDQDSANTMKDYVSQVSKQMAQRHEIEKMTREEEYGGEESSSMVVEQLILGDTSATPSPTHSVDALSPSQISQSTLLGWANYAGLSDALKKSNSDSLGADETLDSLSAYLDAFDECSAREAEDELLDLFVDDSGGSFVVEEWSATPHDKIIPSATLEKFQTIATQERGRVASVRNTYFPQTRLHNLTTVINYFDAVRYEMGVEDVIWERAVGDGGREVYSRQVLFPVKQQFTKKLPKYLDYGHDSMTSSQNHEGKEADVAGMMMTSVEELGRDIARKASVTIKNIATEDINLLSQENDDLIIEGEDVDVEGVERMSSYVDNYADTDPTPPETEGVGRVDSPTITEYGDMSEPTSNGGVRVVTPDGSLACGGTGRPEAKFPDCLHVRAAGNRITTTYLTPSHIVLQYKSNLYDGEAMALEEARVRRLENEGTAAEDTEGYDVPDELKFRTKALRYNVADIAQIYLRRYRLRDSGLEIFMNGAGGSGEGSGSNSVFLDFGAGREGQAKRDNFAIRLMKLAPRNCYKQWPGTSVKRMLSDHDNVTAMWRDGKLTNFDYLMYINVLAGRSMNDITQYPVFPWVLCDYISETVPDLTDRKNFRDLTKPMGALNEERLKDFMERYESFVDESIPAFMYGSHYSTAAGVVLHYNVRLHPFAGLHRQLQGGHFDVSDRLFSSVARTFEMCTSALSEVKELTPEWYSNPAFLKNTNNFNFGTMQDGEKVNDVILPPWAGGSAERFIEINRAALESDIATKMLPGWIDLIFGYKQRGAAAVAAHNVFYYLTYYGSIDLDSIQDEGLRSAMLLQIQHFGQCPQQIFDKRHESKRKKRGRLATIKNGLGIFNLEGGVEHPPFSSSTLSHWLQIPPPPPGPHYPLTKVRIISHNRILAITQSGGFQFYNWSWKMDAKSVHKQEQHVRGQILGVQERRRNFEAGQAAAQALGKDAPETGSFDSTIDETIDEVDYDVGNFECKLDQSSFQTIPRLPNRELGVASCISHRLFSNGNAVLVLSDSNNSGGLSLQLIETKNGSVKNTQTIDNVCPTKITHIDMQFCPSSATEVAAIGCDSGGFSVWTFYQGDENMPRRPTWRMTGLAHSGKSLVGLCVDVTLRVVVSVSEGKACLWSLTSGKFVRSFEARNEAEEDWVVQNVKFSAKGGVAVSKLGYIALVVEREGRTYLQLRTLTGAWLGEVAVEEVNSMKTILDGTAVAVCSNGKVTLHRLSSVRVLEVLDVWTVDVSGFELVGGVPLFDVDFGPGRRVSQYPAVAAAALGDGSLRIHALKGVGKWSRTVGPSLGGAVAGLVSKPISAISKGVFGVVSAIGGGVVSLGKELAQETRVGGAEVVEEVQKTGLKGFFSKVVQRNGSGG